MGDVLGGKFTLGKRREFLKKDGKIDWDKVRRSEFFLRGIEKLINLSKERTTAIMCTEENPYRCHRGFLITPVLVERGLEVYHIRKNLKVYPHQPKET